MPTQLQHTV